MDKRLNLKTKILLPLLISSLAIALLVIITSRQITIKNYEEQVYEQALVIVNTIDFLSRQYGKGENFRKAIEHISAGRNVRKIIIADSNTKEIIAGTRFNVIGKSINDFKDEDLFADLLELKTTNKGNFHLHNDTGFAEYTIKINSSEGPILVGVVISIRDAYSQINRQIIFTSALRFIGDFLILLITYLIISYYVIKPIRRIKEVITSHAKGSTEIINITSEDEIGDLATAYNNLNKKITESQFELDKSRKFLELALNASQDGIWDWDLQSQKVWYSPRWKEILGYTPDELEHNIETWNKLIHPADKESTMQLVNEFASDQTNEFRLIQRYYAKDGSLKYILSRAIKEKDSNGKTIRLVGAHTDVTNLIEAQNKAEEATRLKSDFLANMSHELRTPMNAIVGMADILQKHEHNQKTKKQLATIQNAADSLLEIINDILDFSKIEAGKLELENVNFSLPQLIDDIKDLVSLKCAEKNIELIINYPESAQKFFIGDPVRVKQVIMNLVSNAVKFTASGQVAINILNTTIIEDFVNLEISVTDTGIGIPKDKLEIIFNKFDQVDNTTTRKFGGTGLGLAICKELCHMMNGNIQVSSTLGKGSEFKFNLKLKHANSYVCEIKPTLSSGYKFNNINVLLVEDNIVNQEVSSLILESMGCKVTAANNGLEAISFIYNMRFDIIFMDCQMPEMDGYEATLKIREYEYETKTHPTPIIALTANTSAADKKKCLECGMNAHISKPVKEADLEDAILKFCNTETTDSSNHKSSLVDNSSYKKFLEIAGDKKDKIIAQFIKSGQEYIQNISEGISKKDCKKIAASAHPLKSSSIQLGFYQLGEMAKEFELNAKANNIIFAKENYSSLENLFKATIKIIS